MLSRVRVRLPLAIRADADELLDSGRLSTDEVARNLSDLAQLNRLPGGTRQSVDAIGRLLGTTAEASILDAGTGRADMPLAFAARGWSTVAVDTNPEVLAVARRATSAQPLVDVRAADARSLPFDDGSFDVAHCSLLVHHLDPASLLGMLRELRRVSRRGIVVNDLRRGLFPLLATAVSVAGRSRVTRVDGIASARRAYTLHELDRFLAEARLAVRWRSSSWWPRVVTAATPA